MILNTNKHISALVVLIAFIKCSKSYTHNVDLLLYGEDLENYYKRNNIVRSNMVHKETITPENYLILNNDYILPTYMVDEIRLVKLNEDSEILEYYDVEEELEAFNDPQKNFYLFNITFGVLLMKPKEVQEIYAGAVVNKLAKIMKGMEEAEDEGTLEEYKNAVNDSMETKAENDLLYFRFKLFPTEDQEFMEYWVENKAALRKCAQQIGKEDIIDEINDNVDQDEENDEEFWFNDFKSSKPIGSESYQIYSLRMLRLDQIPLTINLLDHFYPNHNESYYGSAPLSSMDYDPPDNHSAITHIISHCTNTDV